MSPTIVRIRPADRRIPAVQSVWAIPAAPRTDFDAIGALLDRLGVIKRIPDHEDARSVLIDIVREEQARFHLPIEDEDDVAVIWRCWQMLDGALARDEVDAE